MIVMDTTGTALIVFCAALVICPPKYDPAIGFKRWIEGCREREER